MVGAFNERDRLAQFHACSDFAPITHTTHDENVILATRADPSFPWFSAIDPPSRAILAKGDVTHMDVAPSHGIDGHYRLCGLRNRVSSTSAHAIESCR